MNTELSISKILVNNKYILPLRQSDVGIHVVDIPKVSKILSEKFNINIHFRNWCRLTKRSGGVLVGSSIREFFDYVNKELQS